MSDEIIIDDELLDGGNVVSSEPENPFVPSLDLIAAPLRPCGPSWPTIAMLCVVCFFAGSNFKGCDRGDDDRDDSVVIDEDGRFVLVLEDTSEAGQERLTEGQSAAITSTDIMMWCGANKFEFRKLDPNTVDDKKIEPIWNTLIAKAKSPPSLNALVDGQFYSKDMPNGIDEAIQELEAIK